MEVSSTPSGRSRMASREAIIIAGELYGSVPRSALVIGDNIFYGRGMTGTCWLPRATCRGDGDATVFAYHVKDPERYGVVEFDRDGKAMGVEKPASRVPASP